MPEEVDIEFNAWFNRAQPFMDIAQATGKALTEAQWTEIKTAVKRAWIAAYTAGAAAESARSMP